MCEVGDYYEPFEFSCETERKARKDYKCDCCDGLIKRGEIYLKHVSKTDGQMCSERMCGACLIDRKLFIDSHNFYTAPSSTPDLYHECVESREDFKSMLQWSRAMKRIGQRRELTKQMVKEQAK